MQPITPLTFPIERFDTELAVVYGQSCYITQCGRFYVYLLEKDWVVGCNSNHLSQHPTLPRFVWEEWLNCTGIAEAGFSTRREAIEALWHGLTTDGVAIAVDVAELNQTPLTPTIGAQLRL